MAGRKAGTRADLGLVAGRQRHAEAAGDHRPPARRQLQRLPLGQGGAKIGAGRQGAVGRRQGQALAMRQQGEADGGQRAQGARTTAKSSSGRSAVPLTRSSSGMTCSARLPSPERVMLVSTTWAPEMPMVMVRPAK